VGRNHTFIKPANSGFLAIRPLRLGTVALFFALLTPCSQRSNASADYLKKHSGGTGFEYQVAISAARKTSAAVRKWSGALQRIY
jgi:hypothetical protein